MMSDYDRTMELIEAANNSAGASQEQFNKTLEGLDSKLAKLKNSWDEFLMGLANNEIIKGAVDLLNSMLQAVNGIINGVSGGNGLVKSLLTLTATYGGLKIGGNIFKNILGSVKGGIDKNTAESFVGKTVTNIKNSAKSIRENPLKTIFTTQTDTFTETFAQTFKKAFDKTPEMFKGLDISKITKEIDDAFVNGGLDEATKQAEKYGITLDDAAKASLKASHNIEINMNSIAAASAAAGLALKGVSWALNELGLEAQGEWVSNLSNLLLSVSTVLPIASTGLKALGVTATTTGVQIATAGGAATIAWAPFLAILLAVAGGIMAVVQGWKLYKDSTPEAQLEKLTEQTKKSQEAADAAKKSYDELLSAKSGYDELQQKLKDLRKGTDEWNETLQESNDKVLEMLKLYPKLAQYISVGTSGEYVLNEEGYKIFAQEQQQKVAKTQNNALINEITANNLKTQQTISDFEKDLKKIDKRLASYSSSLLNGSSSVFELSNSFNLTEEQTSQLATSTSSYLSILKELKINTESYNKLITTNLTDNYADLDSIAQKLINNFGSASNIGTMASKYGEQLKGKDGVWASIVSNAAHGAATGNIIGGAIGTGVGILAATGTTAVTAGSGVVAAPAEIAAGKTIGAGVGTVIGGIAGGINGYLTYDSFSRDEVEKIAESLNIDSSQYSDTEDLMKKIYAEYTGQLVEELPKDISVDTLTSEVGNFYAQEQYKKIIDTLNTLSPEEQEKYSILFSTTLDDYSKLEDTEIQALLEELAEKTKRSLSEFSDFTGVTVDTIKANQEKLEQQITDLENDFKEKGINAKKLNLDYGTQENILKQIKDMSNDSARAYVQTFNKIVNDANLTEDEKKSLENFLSTVDWADFDSAEQAVEYMKDLGINPEQIRNFWNIAIEGAKAYYDNVSDVLKATDKFLNRISTSEELLTKFKEGTATQADVEELIAAGYDIQNKLTLTAEGWQLSEKDAEEAAEILRESAADGARAEYEATKNAVEFHNELYKTNDTIKGLTSQDADGNYKFADISDYSLEDLAPIAKALKIAELDDDATEEEKKKFRTKVLDEVTKYISHLNDGSALLYLLEETADYTESVSKDPYQLYAEDPTNEGGIYASAALKANNLDVTNEAFATLVEQIQAANEGMTKTEAALEALNRTKIQKGITNLVDSYKDWKELIDETGNMSITNSEDAIVFEEYKNNVNALLGINEDLDTSFYTNAENINLVKKALNGATDSYNDLVIAAKKETQKTIKIDVQSGKEEYINEVQELENYLKNLDLEDINVEASLNEGAFNTMLTTLIQNTAIAAEQIQEILNSLGFNLNLTYETAGGLQLTGAELQQKKDIISRQLGNLVPSKTEQKYVVYGRQWTYSGYTEPVIIGTYDTKAEADQAELADNIYFDTYTNLEDITTDIPGYETRKANLEQQLSDLNSAVLKSTITKIPAIDFDTIDTGDGDNDKISIWENPYDKLINEIEKYNKLLRERNRLENEYELLISNDRYDGNTAAEKRLASYNKLQETINNQEDILRKREAEYANLLSELYTNDEGNRMTFGSLGMSQYASLNTQTGVISYDWDLINANTDEERGAAIESYIARLEELRDSIENARDEITANQLEQLQQREKAQNDIIELENRIKDAIIKTQQDLIDEQQAVSDEIANSNTKMLEAIQQSVDLERQIRDNTKKEDEISEMEARLAYLQRDTSGSNLTEIKQLQDELDTARTEYQDTLVDQEIERLTQTNEEAAQQRETMIAIQQAQLDEYVNSGKIWTEVNGYLSSLMSGDEGKSIQALISATENWDSLSATQLAVQAKEIIAQIESYEAGKKLLIGDTGTDGAGNAENNSNKGNNTGSSATSSSTTVSSSKIPRAYDSQGRDWIMASGLKIYSYPNQPDNEGMEQYYWEDPQYYIIGEEGDSYKVRWAFLDGGVSGWFKKKDIDVYKSGGLVSETGLAWLDGTKGKPEMVLNARDTSNFIALKDILSQVMHNVKDIPKTTQQTGGDAYFDIQIHVDEIGSDYDVDQLAARIKQDIVDSSTYRNVNTINLIR